MTRKTVAIVIVNWNSGGLLRDCLQSISRSAADLETNVVVVDNGSTDGSDRSVADFPAFSLVQTGNNIGFARACNVGATFAGNVDYLLFLNPDACLSPGCLDKSIAFMESPSAADVGICGVALRDGNGRIWRSCSRLPTPLRLVSAAIGLDRVLPRTGMAMEEWEHNRTRRVDQVIGAYFLIRGSLFRQLGGFDERFFVYFEEVDLSLRAVRAGWASVFLADCDAYHLGGGVSGQVKARRLFYTLRSRLLYAEKHFQWPGLMLVGAATLAIEPLVRLVVAGVSGRRTVISETINAYLMLWRWLLGSKNSPR
jgi:GT2 family glycosyltransferase